MKGYKGLIFGTVAALLLATPSPAAQQLVNVGSSPNDGTGDSVRTAFGKTNTNFTEIYSKLLTPTAEPTYFRLNADGSVTLLDSDELAADLNVTTVSNVLYLATSQTVTGNKTFSGTSAFEGAVTLSGTNTLSGSTTLSGAAALSGAVTINGGTLSLFGSSVTGLATPAQASAGISKTLLLSADAGVALVNALRDNNDDLIYALRRQAMQAQAAARFLGEISGFSSKIYQLAAIGPDKGLVYLISNKGNFAITYNNAPPNPSLVTPTGLAMAEPVGNGGPSGSYNARFTVMTGILNADLTKTDLSLGFYSAIDSNSNGDVMGMNGSSSGNGRTIINLGASGSWVVYVNSQDTTASTSSTTNAPYAGLWSLSVTGTTGKSFRDGTNLISWTTSGNFYGTDMIVGSGQLGPNATGSGLVYCSGFFVAKYLSDTEMATLSGAWKRYNKAVGLDCDTAEASVCTAVAHRNFAFSRATFDSGMLYGQTAFTPGKGYIHVEFLRDLAMMVRYTPELFKPSEISKAVAHFFNYQNPTTGELPEAIYVSGDSPYMPRHSNDGPYEMIDLIYSHFRMTGSASLYLQYYNQVQLALTYPTITNELVYAADNATAANVRGGWGFEDSLAVSGYQLMPSVMRYRAIKQMAEMETALGRSSQAATLTALLPTIRTNLGTYLWNASGGSSGLFYAGSIRCNRSSIPGSAYAVVVGAAQGATATAIANSLNDGIATDVFVGCPRNLPAAEAWPVGDVLDSHVAGEFQNGGGWETYTGWYAAAVHLVSPTNADALVAARNLYHRKLPWYSLSPEWIYSTGTPNTGQNASYQASAANVLGYLRGIDR